MIKDERRQNSGKKTETNAKKDNLRRTKAIHETKKEKTGRMREKNAKPIRTKTKQDKIVQIFHLYRQC